MQKEKSSLRLFWCLFFIYTMNTFTKIAFSAVTAAMIKDGVLTKTQAGTVSGVFWFVYALGQFVGGSLASRHPIALLKLSLIGGGLANLLMAFSDSYIPILIIWSINGVLQMGLWPSVLYLLTNYILPEQKSKSLTYIAFCYAIGSILSHVCTAVVLTYFTWHIVFIWCSAMSLISVIPVFYIKRTLIPQLSEGKEIPKAEKKEKEHLPKGFIWKSGLMFFCTLLLIKSFTETGIKTWMPTILMESHGVSPSFTSVLSVVLLVLNLFGVSIGAFIYRKLRENEVNTLFFQYILIVPMMALLLGFRSMNVYILTIIFSLITVMLYGSGQIMSMYYPSRFQNTGAVAFMGGILNCFAAMGNVIASYANGLIADLFGWNVTIIVWNSAIIFFVFVTFMLMPIWNRFRKEQGIK